MDKERTQANGPENKKFDDDAQGLLFERWCRLYVSRKERGREIASIEYNVDANYIKKKQRKINYRLSTDRKTTKN